MAHSFTIAVCGPMSVTLEKVGSEITCGGGIFDGDESCGTFSGSTPLGPIRGEYCCVSPKEIKITIVDKPLLVPFSVIEAKIRAYFG
ncbi:MAG: hypothetical protein M0Z60_00360 [Nitrospiraceae bacterium]|nr:hypothetical protein [Nitrospiraceae bacterium]